MVEFWQSMIVAAVPTLAALWAVWVSTRDLKLRRRLEGTTKFFEVVMTAHGRSVDRPAGVGVAEQIAAINVLASFGLAEEHLRTAAREALREISVMEMDDTPVNQRVRAAALSALGSVESRGSG